jgi:hypothetical protein
MEPRCRYLPALRLNHRLGHHGHRRFGDGFETAAETLVALNRFAASRTRRRSAATGRILDAKDVTPVTATTDLRQGKNN